MPRPHRGLALTASLPIGGRLHKARQVWRLISSKIFVLGVVDPGYRIPCNGLWPQVPQNGRNPLTSEDGKKILDLEVKEMLKKHAIRIVDMKVPGAISGFFARPKKKLCKFCLIISIKYTNSFITYQKFSMTTTQDITKWIRAGYFFTSIDCSDTYFTIPLKESEFKYTRFK